MVEVWGDSGHGTERFRAWNRKIPGVEQKDSGHGTERFRAWNRKTVIAFLPVKVYAFDPSLGF